MKSGEPPSYFAKLNELGVIDIINFNKALTEPFSDLDGEAFLHFRAELTSNFDSYAQQENDETEQDQFESSIQVDSSTNGDHEIDGNTQTQNAEIRNNSMANILHDDEINAKISSLNFKQRQIFLVIDAWGKNYLKNLSSKAPRKISPLHLLVTGGGGCGKSHLIKTIYHSMTKLFLYPSGNPDKVRVLLLAPTGVAAVNIDGTTIHPGLNIPCHGKMFPLSDKNWVLLRNKYSEVQLIIIDEISIVPSKLLFQVHQRLIEIFESPSNILFAGKSVILCGDLYQLPPV